MKQISSLGAIFVVLLFVNMVNTSNITILELTSQTYQKTLQENQYVFIYIYEKSSLQNQLIQLQYITASQSLVDKGIVPTKLEAKNHQTLIKKQFDAIGYPALYLIDEGEKVHYLGERTAKQIMRWCQNYLENRIIQKTDENIEQAHFCIQTKDQKDLRIINKAAFVIIQSQFYLISRQSQSTKIYYKDKTGTKIAQYNGQIKTNELKKWMKEVSVQPIKPLIQQNQIQNILLTQKLPSLILVLTNEEINNKKTYSIIENYCKQNQAILNCGKMVQGYAMYEGAHKYFNDQSNRTLIGIVRDQMRIAYVNPQKYSDITQQSLKQFVNDALNNKLKRTVDNTIPTQVTFEHVTIHNNQTFKEYVHQKKYVISFFYDPQDQSSKYFSHRFDALSKVLEGQEETKDVGISAVDCRASKDFCEERVIQYFPTIRLYIQGISLEFQKQKTLPQIPDVQKFIVQAISKKVSMIEQESQITKPSILMVGPKFLQELEILVKILNIPVYFKESVDDKYRLQYYIGDQVIKYEGDFQVMSVKRWYKSQSGPLLSDLMSQIPDDRLIAAIQNKKPIAFLLDIQKERSNQIKNRFGKVCKQLGVAGAYADGQHPGFSSLLQWVKIKKPTQSLVIFCEIVSDRKYVYPLSLDQMTKQSFSQFISDIKQKKIKQTGQQESVQEPTVETPQVTDL